MDVIILIEHQHDYDIIKHVNKDCVTYNKFKGDGYSLLWKDLATSAINHGYQIIKNGFYIVGSLTANRFSCSRCVQYKGDIKCRQLTLFCLKTFHNDAINSRGIIGKKWVAGV